MSYMQYIIRNYKNNSRTKRINDKIILIKYMI